jgi:hypothetical protein
MNGVRLTVRLAGVCAIEFVLERSWGDQRRDARGGREKHRRHGRATSSRGFMLCHSIELPLKACQRGEKRGGYQGWKLARAESIRPRLVITIQPAPRLSIDFTVPAPGMISPGATSIEPRGLSTRAIPR